LKLILAGLLVFVAMMVAVGVLGALGALENGSPWPPWLGALVVMGVAGLVAALAQRFLREKEGPRADHFTRSVRKAVAGGTQLEPDPELDFRFEFVSTHGDLMNAFRALRREQTGMRGWVRGLVILMGALWLGSFAAIVTFAPRARAGVAPIAWLLFGSFVVWLFVVRPMRRRRAIRRNHVAAQPLALHFAPRFVECDVAGVGKFRRRWLDLQALVSAPKGVVLVFRDGLHWLPRRVFANAAERQRFEAKVSTRIAQESVRLENPAPEHPILQGGTSYAVVGVSPDPDERDPAAFLDVTLRRNDVQRRLRFVRPAQIHVDREALARAPVGLRILAPPHAALDGLRVLAVDSDGMGHLILWAEDVVELDAAG
jgi:hypothetical protein